MNTQGNERNEERKTFCKNYNKLGNETRECRSKNVRPNFSRNNNIETNSIKCYNCGLMRHSIKQCRIKSVNIVKNWNI